MGKVSAKKIAQALYEFKKLTPRNKDLAIKFMKEAIANQKPHLQEPVALERSS